MALRPALLTSVRRMIDERDSDNSHFTDSEIYDYINEAIRLLGTELEWPLQTAEAPAVADQAVYALPEDFIALVDVYFDNRPLHIIQRDDLTAIRSDWQNATSGTPVFAYKSDNAKFGIYPKPSTEETSDDEVIQIQYVKLPANLSDDVTAPDLHTAFHDCLPFYAAYKCEDSMGNSKRAQSKLADYERHKKRIASVLQRFSDELLRFRWSGNY